MTPFRLIALLCIAVFLADGLYAGFSPETGAYIFRNYSAKDYQASPENWAFTEDNQGVLYVANHDGLLTFDGNFWHTTRLASGSELHSVAVDKHGTVYVGAHGDFGFLQADSSGTARLVSLVDRIPQKDRQFGDIWRVLPTSEGVYFSSHFQLFRLNPDGTVKIWHPDTTFGRAQSVAGSIYVKTPEHGLRVIRGDELVSVPGGERFAAAAVEDAIAFGGNVLIAGVDHLYRMTSTGIEAFPTAADRYFGEQTIYSLGLLPGGEIAVGTRKGGLVLLNAAGSVDRVLTKADGLPDNFVTSIYADRQGGVWVAGYGGGISRFNPGLTRFDERAGIQGAFCSIRRGNVLYVGSKAGLFRMKATTGETPRFYPVAGIAGAGSTVRSLIAYREGLLAATDSGVYFVSGDKASPVLLTRDRVFDVSVSPRNPDTVYAAGGNFVFVLHRVGATFQKTGQFEVRGLDFRTPLEDTDGRVWSPTSNGIYRIDFRQHPVTSEQFGAPGRGQINAQRFQDRILFATSKGLLRFSDQAKKFSPDATLGNEFADGTHDVLNIFDDRSGNVWVTGNGYHDILLKQSKEYKKWQMPLLQSGIDEIYGMSLDDDGTAWATGSDGTLFRWERAIAGNPDAGFRVLTRSIKTSDGKNTLYGGFGNAPDVSLPYRSSALRFSFASPFYEEPGAVEYQTFLEGSDRDWSPWTHESHKDSGSLREDSYTFHVRARSPHGTVSEEAVYSFDVLPPWYRTWWAYGAYAIFGGFGVWGIVRWRVRQLEADKRQLEVTVEERTVEIRQQRDEIHVQERKSQALLLNILPSQVADELKSTGAVKPVGFDDVTVCFTDFVGFTLSSEKLSPDRLVDALNEYFTAFDEIVARYGLEKLKTIGDSYMFASGLPVPRASHAVDAVMAAMEMAEVVKRFAAKAGGTGWNIRIGLHSGPVVAGVVGIRKFAFDIWGNTVNFAARMESSGVPGRVNMSERTCRLTRNLIECEFRGQVKIKEGRELPMFLARGVALDFEARYKEEFGEAPRSMPQAVEESGQSLNALVR